MGELEGLGGQAVRRVPVGGQVRWAALQRVSHRWQRAVVRRRRRRWGQGGCQHLRGSLRGDGRLRQTLGQRGVRGGQPLRVEGGRARRLDE